MSPPFSAASPRSHSRRDFLTRFPAGVVAALVGGSSSAAATKPATHAPSTDPSDDPIFMSATKLAGLIRTKKISALEAVEAFIQRQHAINDRLNAVVTHCHERARAEARALDEKAARGEFVGPLHGVPITIKDSLDTEGVVSTAGTFGRQQFVPTEDATVVRRLRRHGAIILGKTNTTEFTLGALSGINAASNLLFGATHNPYDLTRTTDASSGGAAAIVAAGGAAFDIGTDWAGSIRGPAHATGIAGIKPTSVRVPRTGHIVGYGGIHDSWQQLGPMCRRVEDLALITPLIAGPDFRDVACAPVPWADPAAVNLRQLRVGFTTDHGPNTDAATKATIRQAATWLQEVTTSVQEDLPKDILTTLNATRSQLMNGDGWAFYQRLADKWGTNNFSPVLMERMRTRPALPTPELVEAWEQHDEAKSRLLDWMQAYDVYLCPANGEPAGVIDRKSGNSAAKSARPSAAAAFGPATKNTKKSSRSNDGFPSKGTFNSTGWPVVVVRCGTSADGKLPIGVQIVGQPWREDVCLAVASYLESRSGGWQRPPI